MTEEPVIEFADPFPPGAVVDLGPPLAPTAAAPPPPAPVQSGCGAAPPLFP